MAAFMADVVTSGEPKPCAVFTTLLSVSAFSASISICTTSLYIYLNMHAVPEGMLQTVRIRP